MAGSLKVTCATGQTANIHTSAAFSTLNGATAWTIAFFYQFDFVPASGTWSSFLEMGGTNLLLIEVQFGSLNIVVTRGAKTLSKSVPLDTVGHHVAICGVATGDSIIYIDGIPNVATADMGALGAFDSPLTIRWDDTGHAGTFYLRDLSIWGSHQVGPDDAIRLAIGTKIPSTLTPPADNYWSMQGPAGAVTAGADGLVDGPGTADLDSVTGSGAVTYDALEITANPVASVLIMTPYVDTTGYLLYVPLYLNPATLGGGPVLPSGVATNPVFTVAGSPVVPTRLPLDALSCMVAYQFATPITVGQTVTMAASIGWATTASGAVGGTSDAGLGSTAMAVTNYAGSTRDDDDTVVPTFRIGSNMPPYAGAASTGNCGQVMRNWARRLGSWAGNGTVTAMDANNLPASFTGTDVAGYISSDSGNNGMDGRGIPGLAGKLTLIHGDASPGVTSNPTTGHVLQIDLITAAAGWSATLVSTPDAGEWDAGDSAWHRITKIYDVVWSASGGFLNPNLMLKIARVDGGGGSVVIPILPNGQSELGIFEPDPDDPTIPATLDYTAMFDPLAVSPSFLTRHAGCYALRWMTNQLLMTTTGSGDLVYPADLDVRKPTDFLATNTTYTTLDITRVDPVTVPVAVIADYLNGTPSGTIPVSSGYAYRGMLLATTSSPHGIRTGDRFLTTDAPATARAPVLNSTYITLTAGVDASQTVLPFSATTNINGDSSSRIRTVGDGGSYLFQLGPSATDEQIEVVSIAGLNVTVTRGARGTTAQSKPSGTVVYPCAQIVYGGINEAGFAVSSTQLLLFLQHLAVPGNATPLNPTLHHAQTYSPGVCPIFSKHVPYTPGTSTYELCSRATSLVVAANADHQGICWVNIPFFATDAAVTAVVGKMTADFLTTPGMRLIVQVSNEVFNLGFDTRTMAELLSVSAPNPQTSGTGFISWWDYWASRQHKFNMLAKDAFTAAGLDPARVIWYHNGTSQGQIDQPIMRSTIAFCQRWSLPIDVISTNAYADMSASLADTYVSWLPASTGVPGATATWDLATARKVMMSNYRASMRHGITLAANYVSQGLSISRYNHGISVDGSAPAITNAVHGRLCFYEGATTQPLPIRYPGNMFPQCTAWTVDLQYDPEWYQTEWAYYQALQDMPYRHALLMGSGFPDPADAVMEFGCYLSHVYLMQPSGNDAAYSYPIYRWQLQQPGDGTGNRLDSWDPTAPVSHDMTANGGSLPPTINQSVRGQVALDWTAAVAGSPTPTPTPTPPPGSITITPANPNVAAGLTQQFTAIGHYSDSSTQNLTGLVTWASSNTSVATISTTGLATMVGVGTSTITATYSG